MSANSNSNNAWDSHVNDLFLKALEIVDAAARAEFLDEQCRGDAKLRHRIDSMLTDSEKAANFFQKPDGVLDAVADMAVTASRSLYAAEGTVIDRYKLLQRIGDGGFGVVYMAEQERPVRRQVALKVIKPGMDSREVIARFEAERQALAMMDHPNIAKVLDGGTTDDKRPYFVMELVKGVPITEYCDKQNLTTKRRLDLFLDVCYAVQHAHHKGVIHRDIKPSNVMITLHDGKPVPKIIDFGIAKAISQRLTEKTLFTRYGQMIGTPQYMSPEQAEMSGLDIDTRSDVYSLGVLLYELLTGSTPLDAEKVRSAGYAEMVRLVQEDEPPVPSQRISALGEGSAIIARRRGADANSLRRTLHGDLDWIAMKALDKDRDRRYDTASGFAKDIQRHLDDEPVSAGRPGTLYKLKRFARRNRALAFTTAIIAFALIAGTTIATVGLFKAVYERNQATEAKNEANRQRDLAVKTKDERDRANERLKLVLYDQAIADASGGNHENTLVAVEQLRKAGMSESRLQVLLGNLDRWEGNAESALRRYGNAIKLDPSNLTAYCEKLGTVIEQGDFSEFNRVKSEVIGQMQSNPPKTAQDYVAKGFAMTHTGLMKQALELIDKGRAIRDSPEYQLKHAVALAMQGFLEGDLESLSEAKTEMMKVEARFGSDNRLVMQGIVSIARQITLVSRRKGLEVDETLLTLADDRAARLFGEAVPLTMVTCAWYFDHARNDPARAEPYWKRACELSTGDLYHAWYSAFLLEHRGITEALAIFDKAKKRSIHGRLKEGWLLALESEGQDRAEAIWRAFLDRDDQERWNAMIIPLLLGDQRSLNTTVESWNSSATWANIYRDYVVDKVSAEELLEKTGDGYAHFTIAMKSLQRGDRPRAIQALEAIKDARLNLPRDFDVVWGAGILAEMKRKPDWPKLRQQD